MEKDMDKICLYIADLEIGMLLMNNENMSYYYSRRPILVHWNPNDTNAPVPKKRMNNGVWKSTLFEVGFQRHGRAIAPTILTLPASDALSRTWVDFESEIERDGIEWARQ